VFTYELIILIGYSKMRKGLSLPR